MRSEPHLLFDCSNQNDIEYIAGLFQEPATVKEFIKENCRNDSVTYWKIEELCAYLVASGFEKKEDFPPR